MPELDPRQLITILIVLSPLIVISIVAGGAMYQSHLDNLLAPRQPIMIYSDQDCMTEITRLNWTALEPASQYNKTVYLKNTNKYPVNYLFNITRIQPAHSEYYYNVRFNYNGEYQAPDAIQKLVITLTTLEGIEKYDQIGFTLSIRGVQMTVFSEDFVDIEVGEPIEP